MKDIRYAYPTSDSANTHGLANGGYVVTDSTGTIYAGTDAARAASVYYFLPEPPTNRFAEMLAARIAARYAPATA